MLSVMPCSFISTHYFEDFGTRRLKVQKLDYSLHSIILGHQEHSIKQFATYS
jgi:hypothetical protein